MVVHPHFLLIRYFFVLVRIYVPVYSLFQRGLGVIGGQWYSPPSFAAFIVFVYHMILYIIQPYPGIICQVPGYVLLEYPRVLFFVDLKQVFFLAYVPS